MKEGKGNVLVVVLTIMVIVLGCLCAYLLFNRQNCSDYKNNGEGYKLNVYGIASNSYSNSLYVCKSKSAVCNDIVLTLDVETNNAFVLDIGGDEVSYGMQSDPDKFSYILYSDNGLKLYNLNTKKTEKINIGVSNEEISIDAKGYWSFVNGGFIYRDYGTPGDNPYLKQVYYFDLETKEKKYSEYDNIDPLVIGYYGTEFNINSSRYLLVEKNDVSYIIDIKTNKEIIKKNEWISNQGVKVLHLPCTSSYSDSNEVVFDINNELYDRAGKLITKIGFNEKYVIESCQDWDTENAIVIYKISSSKVRGYDMDGKLVK